jgi:hypothetical protein
MAEILRKKANARIRGAEGRGPGQAVTSSLDALAGGTWVGGEVVLTDEFLAFGANRLNRLIQRGELDVVIDLVDITGAAISGGIGTRIIDVDLADESRFSFRCFGAKEVLTALLDARRAAGPT